MGTTTGLVTTLAVLLAACSGSPSAGPTSPPSDTPAPNPAPAPPAPSPTETETAAPGATAYFLLDGLAFGGPYLVPVWAADADGLEDAVEALLAGPAAVLAGTGFGTAGLSTAIPDGTGVRAVSVTDGTATVDLSGTFDDGGGSASMTARLAQLVFTVTAHPGVEGVELRLDGEPVQVFSGEGLVLDPPLTRADQLDTGLVPKLAVDRPAYGEIVGTSFLLAGTARDLFEATFVYEVTDGDEQRFAGGPVTAQGSEGWNRFRMTVTAEVPGRTTAAFSVSESSAEDGSTIFQLGWPIAVDPGRPPGCSALDLDPTVAPRTGLPDAVAEMRAAIAAAAVSCDLDELVLLGDAVRAGLRVSFGGGVDPRELWAAAEAGGYGPAPMFHLRTLLDLPFVVDAPPEGEGQPLYVWPAAAGSAGTTDTTIEDIVDAGLYTREQVDDMIATVGGYTGYRVMIAEDGDWQLFVTGD